MNTTSQEQQILKYLRSGHSLTPLEALDKFGAMRAGARVYTLREQGWPIKTAMIRVPSGKRVACYWMGRRGRPQ